MSQLAAFTFELRNGQLSLQEVHLDSKTSDLVHLQLVMCPVGSQFVQLRFGDLQSRRALLLQSTLQLELIVLASTRLRLRSALAVNSFQTHTLLVLSGLRLGAGQLTDIGHYEETSLEYTIGQS